MLTELKRGITIENIAYCNIISNEEGIDLNDTIFSKTSTRKDIGKLITKQHVRTVR